MTAFSDGKAGPAGGDSLPPRIGPASASTLERIARGDRSAVAECLDLHGDLVWSLARQACPNRADAEDLVQDVFIDVWKNAARFNPALGSETTFVAMIARRRLIDRLRRRRSRPAPGPLPDDLASGPALPTIERADDVARAAEAIGTLGDDQRRVLTLSLRDGLTYGQIARDTGLPLGTVKTHARRGLIRLREILFGAAPPATRSPREADR